MDEKNTSLATIVNKKKIGDTVKVKVWREGKESEVGVRLEKRED